MKKEFIAPYSFGECVRYIRSLDSKTIFPLLSTTKVSTWNTDDHTCHFRIQRWANLALVAIVTGSLVYKGTEETHVVLQGKLPMYLTFILILYMVIGTFVTSTFVAANRDGITVLAVIMLIFGGITWLVWGLWYRSLTQRIYKSLRE